METGTKADHRIRVGGLLLIAALLASLVACGSPPAPPSPVPETAPAEEPVIRVDPQLNFAIRLADAALTQIAQRHVEPVPVATLQTRFIDLLIEELADGPWREPRPAGAQVTLAGSVRDLHQNWPARPILPAVEQALASLVRQLDSDSVYFDRPRFQLLQRQPAEAAGIGILLGQRAEQVLIRDVVQGGPADKAGLKPGDELQAIDGQSLSGRPLDWIMTLLHGEPGSTLAIRVGFAEGDSRNIRLRRESVVFPLVEGRWLSHGIAYIQLRALSTLTLEEFNASLLGLIRKQRPPRGLVLDLRHNRGGVLDSAVQLTDMFLAEGTILSLRGRKKSELTHYVARPRSKILEQGLPLAVLINGETASGAESIAAALQDHQRALLLGERSRGDGLFYSVIELPGKRGLKLASGQLLRAAGNPIAEAGVVPDICVVDGEARLIPRDTGGMVSGECRSMTARIATGTDQDPVLEQAARLLVNQSLYRELLEGRRQALPAP